MGFFDRFKRQTPTQAFWSWFAKLAPGQPFPPNVGLLHSVGERLREIHPGLGFQIGQLDGGLVIEISGEGRKAMIPVVQEVCASVPAIEGWKVVAFRQPVAAATLHYGQHAYSLDAIHFVQTMPGDLDIYLEQFDAMPNDVGPIAFLFLDAMLGEYGVMTRVGKLQFFDATQRPPTARPLRELPGVLGGN